MAIQDELRLTPLSQFGRSDWQVPPDLAFSGERVAFENPIKRYTVGDRTQGLITNDDGSLDIYLQHESPREGKQKANWLPAPAGGFYLNLRMYVPDDSLQKGTWKPPAVKMVD